APVVTAQATGAPASSGWYNSITGAPVIHFSAVDPNDSRNLSGSGVVGSTVPADQTLGEGVNLGTSATISDLAGNSSGASISGLMVDLTPTQTTVAVDGTAGNNGWYTSAVSVSLAASDSLSGVAASYYTVDGGPQQTYCGPFSLSNNGI